MLNTGTQVKPESEIKNNLAQASDCASRGDAGHSDTFIGAARRNAERAGIKFTAEQEAEIAGIVKLANTNAVGVNLAQASDCASRGDAGHSDTFIGAARRNAERAGIKFTAEQEAEIAGINKRLSRE